MKLTALLLWLLPLAILSAQEDVAVQNAQAQKFLGTYTGTLGRGKITLALDRVIGSTVTGYSIYEANERAFSGSFEPVDGGFALTLKEPGDDADDGVFQIQWNGKDKSLSGTWTSASGKGASVLSSKRKDFKYNAKAGTYPQSSTRRLREKDVENMPPDQLRIMRNEIYARHGYAFQIKDMREYFLSEDWYMPISRNVTDSLTDVEKENAALIKRYEKYNEDYYDKFGR